MGIKSQKLLFRFLVLLLTAASMTRSAGRAEKAVFLKGPYLQNVKQHAITIMWETEEPTIGKVVFGKGGSLDSQVVEADSSTIHEITLTGLEPETLYRYQAISGDLRSDIYTFRTAVRKETPFSFAVYGDNKNGPFNHAKIADLILSKNPNFVIHNGDMVDRGYVYKQWQKLFFSPARRMMRSVPLFPAIGNHEYHAKYYFDFFSLPNNELWYSFDFGNAHFVVLDSDKKYLAEGSEQLDWLIKDLKANTATWTFVSFHHAPFTAGGYYFTTDRIYRKNLLHPIFEKYGVDIVLNGHDHHYERTHPIVSRMGKNPVTYVVCGNGGTPMRYIGNREWTLYTERVFGFVLIHIDGERLHFQAINIDDEVIDEFILDRGDPKSIAAYEQNKIFFEDIHDPVRASELYGKGKRLLKREQFAEALSEFEKAYDVDSTCVEALIGMAKCYVELGQPREAIPLAREGIEARPTYPESYRVLADAYVAQGDYQEALGWCRRWAAVEPDKTGPGRMMAKIYRLQNKPNEAIAAMEAAIKVNPAKAALYFELGKLYEMAGRQEKAMAAYEKGLEWFMDEKEKKVVQEARAKLQMWAR